MTSSARLLELHSILPVSTDLMTSRQRELIFDRLTHSGPEPDDDTSVSGIHFIGSQVRGRLLLAHLSH